MHMQPVSLMVDDAISINDEAWYINSICRSGVTKTPTLAPPGSKQRLMVDILGISLSSCQNQCNSLLARRELGSYGCRQIASSTMKPWAQLFADTDEEMEKMTLREIQVSLRKARGRPMNKEISMSSNGVGTSLSVEDETPSVAFELLWEDSTSNSSDNASFGKGVSSTWDASQNIPDNVEAQISKAGDATNFSSRQKRSSVDSETGLETEVSEDDDWTLLKWQQLLKQDSRRKRLKKRCKLEQETFKSVDGVCSSGPSLVAQDPGAAISQIKGSHPVGVQDTHCLILRDSSETACNGCDQTAQMPSLEGVVQGKSSQIAIFAPSHSTVRLELEDETELVTSEGLAPERLQMSSKAVWAFKPCSKVLSTPTLRPASSSHAKAGIKPFPEMSSRIASDILGGQPERKGPMPAEVGVDRPNPIPSGPTSDRVWKSKPVTSKVASQISVDQICSSGATIIPSNLFEGGVSLEHCVGTKLPEQVHSGVSQESGKGFLYVSASLHCNESLEFEEEQELQREPAKIPCKRKAISPMSQEFLLKASKLGISAAKAETKGWIDSTTSKRSKLIISASTSFGRRGQREEALRGPSCYRKPKEVFSEATVSSVSSPAEEHVAEVAIIISQQNSPQVQATISTSPPEPQNFSKATSTSSPAVPCPLVPAKGILRSSFQACQGPCFCEGCVCLRSRAERASEFSQRQMQDIEGLAVKLMKDLSILRNIVEERLIQSPSKHQGSQPNLSLDQLKKATVKASETEETAKRWLVRMARDCNRYCKIMRMQGRKLTFADESGGKLCHVKVFQSEPILNATTGSKVRPVEVNSCTSSAESEPSVEGAQRLVVTGGYTMK